MEKLEGNAFIIKCQRTDMRELKGCRAPEDERSFYTSFGTLNGGIILVEWKTADGRLPKSDTDTLKLRLSRLSSILGPQTARRSFVLYGVLDGQIPILPWATTWA